MIHIDQKACKEIETLYLVRTREQFTWLVRHQGKEKIGDIIKIDLRPYVHQAYGFDYDEQDYREATIAEKLAAVSGKRDMVIRRYGRRG